MGREETPLKSQNAVYRDTAFPKEGHGLRPFSGLFRLTVEKTLEKAWEVDGGGGPTLPTQRLTGRAQPG